MPSLEKSATHSVHEYKYKAWWGPSSPTSSKMESNDHLSAKEAKTPKETAEKRRQGAGNPQTTEAEVSPLGWSKIFLPLAPDFFPFLGWVSVPAQVRRPPAGSPGLQDMMLFLSPQWMSEQPVLCLLVGEGACGRVGGQGVAFPAW